MTVLDFAERADFSLQSRRIENRGGDLIVFQFGSALCHEINLAVRHLSDMDTIASANQFQIDDVLQQMSLVVCFAA